MNTIMQHWLVLIICIAMCSALVCAQEVFTLTVAEAGERAVMTNAEIQYALRDLDLQYKAFGFTIRNFLPELSFGFTNNDVVNSNKADVRLMSISVSLMQPIWDGGSALLARAKKKRELDEAVQNLWTRAWAIRELAVSLANTMLILEKKVLLQKHTYELAQQQLAIMEQEVALGLLKDIDFQKSKFKVEELALSVRKVELEYLLTKLDLKKLLHLSIDFKLADTIPEQFSPISINIEKIYSKAVEQSPEVQDLLRKIKNLKDEIRIMQLRFLPTIALYASLETATDVLPFSNYSWSFGVKLGFSSGIFAFSTQASYGSNSLDNQRTIIEEGDASPLKNPAELFDPLYYNNSLNNLVLQLEEKKRDLKIIVEDLVLRYGIVTQTYAIAVQSLALVQQEYNLAIKQKELGFITELDVLNVSLAILEKQIAVLDVRFDLIKIEREFEKLANIPAGSLQVFLGG